MLSATLKTILIDGDLDDSSLLLDVQHPYRDKDLLTNQFDDVEDDAHDQVRKIDYYLQLIQTTMSLSI
jgi:predicted HD phosphohydrolase